MTLVRAVPALLPPLFALALVGCGGSSPAPALADAASLRPAPASVLHAGDEIEVKFFYTPELSERQVIRPDGMIALALIGEVTAAGLSVPELRARLLQAYAATLKAPDLAVLVRAQPSNRVFVAGEVNQQGAQPLVGGTTITQAVAAAAGLKTTAYTSQTLLVRTRPDGTRDVRSIDLDRVLRGEAPDQDVELQAFDLVFVPRSPIANVDLFVEQYIRGLLPFNPTLTVQP